MKRQGWRLVLMMVLSASTVVSTLQDKFGKIVRQRREAAGLSQESLAAKAGIHRNYVSLVERGLRTPTILILKQLAEALETTMASLVTELEAHE
jgi:transcriptional regulator with XRE-family HTH domain